MKKQKIKTVFLECGVTSRSPFNTGIQRVVRSISDEMDALCKVEEINFVLVDFSSGKLVRMRDEHSIKKNIWLYNLIKYWVANVIKVTLGAIILNKIKLLYRRIFLIKKSDKDILDYPEFEVKNSVLILIDSNWRVDLFDFLNLYRSKGGKVFAVLYDLIPFSHPETVEENTRYAHTAFWSQVHLHVDSVMCISKSVRAEYIKFLTKDGRSNNLPEDNIGYFYLGADFLVKDPFIQLLQENDPFYLVVGSLEPRKNHATVIDAFEFLWKKGLNCKLVIVGAHGWKCDILKSRIFKHKEFGEKLFLISDANDRILSSLYRNSRAVIMASLAEGFGLPIIEASVYRKKVYCSDIPVFREVSTDSTKFFPPKSSEILSELIETDFLSVVKNNELGTQGHTWIGWRSSAHQLLENIKTIYNDDFSRLN